jgi:hypothetical protein
VRFKNFALCLFVVLGCCIGVVCAEDVGDWSVSPTEYVEESLPSDNASTVFDASVTSVDQLSDDQIISISQRSLAPVTSDDATGLKKILLDLFGSYDPVIIEYEYSSSGGYVNYLREVQPDYVWFAAVLIFMLVLYCIFRLGGALFCRL